MTTDTRISQNPQRSSRRSVSKDGKTESYRFRDAAGVTIDESLERQKETMNWRRRRGRTGCWNG
jgi:hypothetical protein